MDLARRNPSFSAWLDQAMRAAPATFCFCILALLFSAFHLLGMPLNGDFDDLLKMVEIRQLIETGDVFDRTLPGIAQPEPYVTHWPWIVDLPYAAFAMLLRPLVGQETALSLASFCVPLLLLAPVLHALHRLIVAAGFAQSWAVLPIVAVFSMRALFEFAPGRIDYHNLQILLLLWALALLLTPRRGGAFVNGVLTALALAISLEFALFYGLLLAVVAWDFVSGRDTDGQRIRAFGAGLAVAGAALYVAIVPPGAYGGVRCDFYSMPHVAALAWAGMSFAAASYVAGTPARRLAVLAVLAAGGAALLYHAYPQCRAGPYGSLSDYVFTNQFDRIDQEKSLLRRPDFVLSINAASMAVLFVGALALTVIAVAERFASRARVILALFALLGLVQAVAYFRYIRYLPLFSGLGFAFLLAALVPPNARFAALLKSDLTGRLPAAPWLALPGLSLTALLVAYHLAVKPTELTIPAARIADSCGLEQGKSRYDWPAGARVMATPRIGIFLLSNLPSPQVVSVPTHPASFGIERAYRFLDPETADPRSMLEQAAATHVAVCAWRGPVAPVLAERFPLAAALMEGRPPSWLTACRTEGPSELLVYAYKGAACPTGLR